MNVTIQERKFSFRSEYDISAPGSNWYARKIMFSFGKKLQLQTEDGKVLALLRSRFSLLRAKFDFELSDGRIYHFRCEKIWKGVFVCEGAGQRFRLYEHKGLRYSIFQDDQQIAAFTKNRLVIGKGNEYDVQMNQDADLVIVVCIVLTINTSEDDDDRSSVTFDFGNIGPEERPFDESWEPS